MTFGACLRYFEEARQDLAEARDGGRADDPRGVVYARLAPYAVPVHRHVPRRHGGGARAVAATGAPSGPLRRLRSLEQNPTPRWSDTLYGEWEGYRRFRVAGVYRVIGEVDFHARRVEVARIGHRRTVYR